MYPSNPQSVHIFIDFPSPTLHLHPSSKICQASQISLHVYDGVFPTFDFIKHDVSRKYLAFNNLCSSKFVSFITLQLCLAKRVLLKLLRSFWNPSSSLLLTFIYTFVSSWPSEFFSLYFLVSTKILQSSSLLCHKKCLGVLSSSWYRLVLTWPLLLLTPLAPCESNFSFHLWSFCHTLEFRFIYTFFFQLSQWILLFSFFLSLPKSYHNLLYFVTKVFESFK